MPNVPGMRLFPAPIPGDDSRTGGILRSFRIAIATVTVAAVSLVLPGTPASADITFNQRVLELINGDRAANGIAPLVVDPTLAGTAEDAPYSGCGFTVNGR